MNVDHLHTGRRANDELVLRPWSFIPRLPFAARYARVWAHCHLRVAAWVILVLAVGVSVIGAPAPAALGRLFFGVVLLAGFVAAAGLGGTTAQLGTALAILALVVAQRAIVRPVYEPPSPQWTRTLQSPDQVIQHVVDLPIGEPRWQHLWQRAAGAAVFVCARGPLADEDGLLLDVNGERLATITQAHVHGARPQPTSVGFYRIPVSRQLLERRRPAVFALRRAPDASPRPVEICGSFTYQPSAGLDSSTFFDGVNWWHPGTSQQGRFVVEVRIEDAHQRVLAALY